MSSQFDDLKRLSDMLAEGTITQEEFDRLKASVLAENPTSAAVPISEPSSTAKPAEGGRIENQTRWWLIGSGVLMVVGSFLPWARAGIFSLAGTDGDGVLTLIGGVIVALVGVANRASVLTGLGTAVVSGFSLWVVATVFGNFANDTGGLGTGLFVTGLASLFALIAGLKVLGQARRDQRR